MSHKPIAIILFFVLLLTGAVVFGIWQSGTENQSAEAAANRTGLVGYWTMNSGDKNGTSYYDRSGFNNTATSTGSPTIAVGKINQAINLNGTTDYLTVADSASLSFGSGGTDSSFTLSAWVKPDVAGAAYIFGKEPLTTNNNREWLLLGHTDGKIYFALYSLTGADRISVTGPNTSLTAGRWHQVVATYDGTESSNGMKIFVDTAQVDNATDNLGSYTGLTDTSSHVVIGAGDRQVYFHDGLIDEARIYNRALSAAEVTQLYNSTKINRENSPARASSTVLASNRLVGWWNMDANDINGTTYYDKSGFNNTATSTASPTIVRGKKNQALGLNGSTQYLSIGDADSLTLSNNMTISMWIKAVIANAQYIVQKGIYNQDGYILALSATGNIDFYTSQSGAAQRTYTSTVLPSNVWTHLVVKLTNGTPAIFVNNVEASYSLKPTHTAPANGATTLFIGKSATVYYVNGSIDDVRVYSYALSAQEIANLYNASKVNRASTPARTGLVGWWTMDNQDRSRNLIYDKSGFNNHGTITGATTSTGIIKEARNFNGTSDWISVPSMDIAASGATLSAWFKADTIANNIIFGKIADTDTYVYLPNTTTVSVQTDVSGTVKNYTVPTMSTGVWYHLIVTRDSNTTRAYLNGVQSSSGGQTQTDVMTVNEIGRYSSGASGLWWDGLIDDVRIYNRALSAQEIVNLYNAAKINFIR